MSKQLGPVEISCDAPPYCVVRACRGVGIRSPEDVRWLRLSTFHDQPTGRSRGVVSYLRDLFCGEKHSASGACTCGRQLPDMEVVIVMFNDGEEVSYLLAQCARCRTVFWDVP